MKRFSQCLAVLLFAGAVAARAVIIPGGEGRELTPPADPALHAVWDLHGAWQDCCGIPVAQRWFVAVAHVGVHLHSDFTLGGKAYHPTEVVEVQDTDLLLYKVDSDFPAWVELWDPSQGGEGGKAAAIFGRGMPRGPVLTSADGRECGWRWMPPDGKLSHGTNVISSVLDAGPHHGDMLVWTFDRDGGGTEGALADGDSGGGVFLQDSAGRWRLAGLNYGLNPVYGGEDTEYRVHPGEKSFMAAVHDERGLWKGLVGREFTLADPKLPGPVPMTHGATRLAPHAEFIRAVIAPGSTLGASHRPKFKWTRHKVLAAGGLAGAAVLLAAWLSRRRGRACSGGPDLT